MKRNIPYFILIVVTVIVGFQFAHTSPKNMSLLTVHFDTNSYAIRKIDYDQVVAFAAKVKERKGRFLLIGHADERGSEAYNLMLGDKRARSVLRYFIEAGLDANRFLILSKGKAEPIDPSHRPAAWKKNRRVEILIW